MALKHILLKTILKNNNFADFNLVIITNNEKKAYITILIFTN